MKTVLMIHNRPADNDCYDEFAAWLAERVSVAWRHWRDAISPGGDYDVAVCCMQDPVGRMRRKRVPEGALNAPGSYPETRAEQYAAWRAAGIVCPDGPWPYSWDTAVGKLPVLLKDLTKHMGRGYLCKTEDRLRQVVAGAAKFDGSKYSVLPYYPHDEMRRYLVAGGRALPTALAVRGRSENQWCVKSSQMGRVVKAMTPAERDDLAARTHAFWRSEPPEWVTRCVSALGLHHALVDSSPIGGLSWVWEVNPYANLRTGEVVGKRERHWPFMANAILGEDRFPVPEPTVADAEEQVRRYLEWEGHPNAYWSRQRTREEQR